MLVDVGKTSLQPLFDLEVTTESKRDLSEELVLVLKHATPDRDISRRASSLSNIAFFLLSSGLAVQTVSGTSNAANTSMVEWIEDIRLRSAGGTRDMFRDSVRSPPEEADLLILARTPGEGPGLVDRLEAMKDAIESMGAEIRLYRHAIVATDLAVHIVHRGSLPDRPDTALGDRVAALLEDYGLVSRSLWVRIASTPPGRQR